MYCCNCHIMPQYPLPTRDPLFGLICVCLTNYDIKKIINKDFFPTNTVCFDDCFIKYLL